MFYRSQLIKHFLRANSRHGTHSPYVYALADRAIYRSEKAVAREIYGLDGVPTHYREVLARMLSHWNKRRIAHVSPQQPAAACHSERTDVWWVPADQLAEKMILEYLSDDVILVVDGIYRHKRNRYAWQRAKQLDHVTIAIDLFHFGVLIKRAGQVKENFTLRYPYWLK